MLTRTLTRLLLTVGLAAAAISPVALAQRGGGRPAPPDGPAGITLFSDTNFRGNAVELAADQPNFNLIRFNDQARSIEVRGGVWMVCADGNYRGRCEYIDRSVSNLGEIGLSGEISSVKRVPYDKGPRSYDITFFADGNYSGAFVGFDGDEAVLSQFNDTASSVMINRGTWLVCEDADFRGQCELLDASTGNLATLGLNDRISSFRRYDVRREGPWRRPVAPVAPPIRDTRDGFQGEQTVFFPAPTYNGRRINDGSGAATRYCQSLGFYEAVYKSPGPVLSDVVCR